MLTAGGRRWLFYFAVALLWGSQWIADNLISRSFPPYRGLFLRIATAAAVCWIVVLAGRSKLGDINWRLHALAALTFITLPLLLFAYATARVNPSYIPMSLAFAPLACALFEATLSHRTVGQGSVLRLVIGTGAIVALMFSSFPQSTAGRLGASACLLAVVMVGVGSVFAQRAAASGVMQSAAIQLSMAAAMTIFPAALEHSGNPFSASSLGLLLALALGSALSWLGLYRLLQIFRPHQAATVFLLAPIFAIFEAALLDRERPPLVAWIAAIVVVRTVASVLAASDEAPGSLQLNS